MLNKKYVIIYIIHKICNKLSYKMCYKICNKMCHKKNYIYIVYVKNNDLKKAHYIMSKIFDFLKNKIKQI